MLQNPALQKVAKVWYMLRAHVLQLTAVYLSLPPARLSPELRQRVSAQGEPLGRWKPSLCAGKALRKRGCPLKQPCFGAGGGCRGVSPDTHGHPGAGWKTPETALAEAYKLFRSIILLLVGSDVLGAQKPAAEAQFIDCGEAPVPRVGGRGRIPPRGEQRRSPALSCGAGDNVLQKWQVLAEVLGCTECLVALLSRAEVVCRAKAFCLEAVRLATRLQASRW